MKIPEATATVIQTLFYLLQKLGQADKLKLVKLVYLADKYHLLHHGRLITGDRYFAMKNGPVGSATLNVLNLDPERLSEEELAEAGRFFECGTGSPHSIIARSVACGFEMLSDSDKSALDFIAKEFGNRRTWDLVDYVHELPEWKMHEPQVKGGGRKAISISEMFSATRDHLIEVDPDLMASNKEFATGMFE